MEDDSKDPDATRPIGPRGGTTTRTRTGMVKKNMWIRIETAEALRTRAFEEHRSEADIIREGLRLVLGAEPDDETQGAGA